MCQSMYETSMKSKNTHRAQVLWRYTAAASVPSLSLTRSQFHYAVFPRRCSFLYSAAVKGPSVTSQLCGFHNFFYSRVSCVIPAVKIQSFRVHAWRNNQKYVNLLEHIGNIISVGDTVNRAQISAVISCSVYVASDRLKSQREMKRLFCFFNGNIRFQSSSSVLTNCGEDHWKNWVE